VALLSEHHLSSQPFPAGIAAGRNFDGAVGRRQASARIGVARGCRTASIARIGSPPAMTDRRVRGLRRQLLGSSRLARRQPLIGG
jgi:hypothetical protein